MKSIIMIVACAMAAQAQAQTISGQQAAQYWIQAGGNSGNCADAVSVAMAESGLNTQARNVNTDSHHSVDRGLWQINNYWHPEISDSCAYDAGCNAKAALKISSGGSNWSPWATYNGGAYKSHLSAARAACGELAPQEKEVANEAQVGGEPAS